MCINSLEVFLDCMRLVLADPQGVRLNDISQKKTPNLVALDYALHLLSHCSGHPFDHDTMPA